MFCDCPEPAVKLYVKSDLFAYLAQSRLNFSFTRFYMTFRETVYASIRFNDNVFYTVFRPRIYNGSRRDLVLRLFIRQHQKHRRLRLINRVIRAPFAVMLFHHRYGYGEEKRDYRNEPESGVQDLRAEKCKVNIKSAPERYFA